MGEGKYRSTKHEIRNNVEIPKLKSVILTKVRIYF